MRAAIRTMGRCRHIASCYRPTRTKPRRTHLTAWPRTSNIAGMREGVPAASTRCDVTLPELESELEALLVEYESLSQA